MINVSKLLCIFLLKVPLSETRSSRSLATYPWMRYLQVDATPTSPPSETNITDTNASQKPGGGGGNKNGGEGNKSGEGGNKSAEGGNKSGGEASKSGGEASKSSGEASKNGGEGNKNGGEDGNGGEGSTNGEDGDKNGGDGGSKRDGEGGNNSRGESGEGDAADQVLGQTYFESGSLDSGSGATSSLTRTTASAKASSGISATALLFVGVTMLLTVAFMAALSLSSRSERKTHPLQSAIQKRMSMFAHHANHQKGKRPPRVVEEDYDLGKYNRYDDSDDSGYEVMV